MTSDMGEAGRAGYAFYSIASAGAGWVVRLNRRELGPPVPMEEAVETAVRTARRDYQPGTYAHVVLDDGKRVRTLWLNGRLASGVEESEERN